MNLLGMLLLCALATQVWGAEPLPNIILCMGDDHGWDETGYKGQLYEGGLRVPGIIEWPARMAESRTSDVHAVTSDILPTLCELAGVGLPARPLDGISLRPLLDGQMDERPSPICFWSYPTKGEGDGAEPYIALPLQEGTTPLVKLAAGRATRNFNNFHHRQIAAQDFQGPRAILDNRYKLILDAGPQTRQLFDVELDPKEENNLIADMPDRADRLEEQLRQWQQSVLHSLSGGDYASASDAP